MSQHAGYQCNFQDSLMSSIPSTMKWNLQCKEMKSALLVGQNVVDQHVFTIPMFLAKLRVLIAFRTDGKMTGNVRSHVCVIIFQDRGLSHAHCIVFLTTSSNTSLRQPNLIEAIISAEISRWKNKLPREIVFKPNMNSLCDQFHRSSLCINDRVGTNRFPKHVVDETGPNELQMHVIFFHWSSNLDLKQHRGRIRLKSHTELQAWSIISG